MSWWPFGKRATQKAKMSDNAEKLAKSLTPGQHKQLDVVVQESGLTRAEILASPGVRYAALSDQVRLDHPEQPAPKRFVVHGKD